MKILIKFMIIGSIIMIFNLVFIEKLGIFSGSQPIDLGVSGQRLKPPSLRKNSVSSQSSLYPNHAQLKYADIDPLALKNNKINDSMQHLLKVLKDMPNIKIIEEKPDYIYAQARSKIFRYIDDVEFWANPEKRVIDVRSASRLGTDDYGVNRQRIEDIRAKYNAAN